MTSCRRRFRLPVHRFLPRRLRLPVVVRVARHLRLPMLVLLVLLLLMTVRSTRPSFVSCWRLSRSTGDRKTVLHGLTERPFVPASEAAAAVVVATPRQIVMTRGYGNWKDKRPYRPGRE